MGRALLARVGSPVAPAAAVVVLASALLAGCSVLTVPDLVMRWGAIDALKPEAAGAAVFAALIAVAVFATVVRLSREVWAGSSLLAAAGAAFLARWLSDAPASGFRVTLGLLVTGITVGLLSSAGLVLARQSSGGVAAWASGVFALSLGVGLPLLAVAAIGRRSEAAGWGLRPPIWLFGSCAAVVAVGGLGALAAALVDPRASTERPVDLDETRVQYRSWGVLLGGMAVVGIGGTALGLQHRVSSSWARPIVLLGVVAAAAVLVAAVRLAPSESDVRSDDQPGATSDGHERQAACALVASLLVTPVALQLVVTGGSSHPNGAPWWLWGAVAAAAFVGVALAWRIGVQAGSLGLLVQAAGAAAAWPMPSHWWAIALTSAGLSLGLAVSVVAALRAVAPDSDAWRHTVTLGFVAMLVGMCAGAPVTWALGAPLAGANSTVAAGRVVLGLCFATCVLAAALAWLLAPAARTTSMADGPLSLAAGANDREVSATASS